MDINQFHSHTGNIIIEIYKQGWLDPIITKHLEIAGMEGKLGCKLHILVGIESFVKGFGCT